MFKSTCLGAGTPFRRLGSIAAALGVACAVLAHADDRPAAAAQTPSATRGTMFDSNVQQVGCTSCDSGWGGVAPTDCFKGCANGCPTGSCNGHCYPGIAPCGTTNPETFIGRFCNEIKCCFCCPDRCYEPRWIAAANSAFYTDNHRPVSQTRIRWDKGMNLVKPDRNEFFWARTVDGKGPRNVEDRVDFDSLTIVTEAGSDTFSVAVSIPYISIEAQNNPHEAGFTDMDIATKSVLFDREIFTLSLQFRTYIPIGVPSKGYGNGHATLEPSFLFGLHLAKDTYVEGQIGEWIPISADDTFNGPILRYNASVNRVLWRPFQDVQLIGNMEMTGNHFQDGAYRDGFGAIQNSAGVSYVTVGPGFRLVVCDRFDIGCGAQFAVTNDHFADQQYRTEIRLRF